MIKKTCLGLMISALAMILLPEAEIKFKSQLIDFGKVDMGKIVEIKFEFENVGDKSLIIQRIIPSCGCTTVQMKKKQFSPGEKGEIPIQFNSYGYSGKVIKEVNVQTNDKKHPTDRLVINGEVILKNYSLLRLDSQTLEFKSARIGQRYRKVIKVTNTGNIDLIINELTHSADIIPEFSQDILGPGKSADLMVVFRPSIAGKYSRWININTNSYQAFSSVQLLVEVED